MGIAVKNKIVEKILQSDDDMLLNEVNALMGLSEKDFGHDLPYQVKLVLKKAHEQLDAGEDIPHKQVMDEVKARFLKK